MLVATLNIGLPQKVLLNGRECTSGICKQPVQGPQRLTATGFVGDGVADTRHHGGHDKAVCVYSLDHYPSWEKFFGTPLPDAAFGENLTVTGLREYQVAIGDIFRLGTATVQVSQPRQPCKTLAARFERNDFVKLVVDSGRTGFYLRVLEEGTVQAGDELTLIEADRQGVTIAFANRILHTERSNREGLETVLAVPALSEAWRKSFEELRAKLAG